MYPRHATAYFTRNRLWSVAVLLPLLLLCCMPGPQAVAQTVADSVDLAGARASASDSSQIQDLHQQAENAIKQRLYKDATEMASAAWELANRLEMHSEKGHSLLLLAQIHTLTGERGNALQHYLNSLQSFTRGADTLQMASVNLKIGDFYQQLEAFDKATEYYADACRWFKATASLEGETDALSRKAKVQSGAGQPGKAAETLARLQQVHRQAGNMEELVATTRLLVMALNEKKQFHKALAQNLALLELQREQNDIKGVAATSNNIGVTYAHLGMPDSALVYYRMAYHTDKLVHGEDFENDKTLVNMGLVSHNAGAHSKALQYMQMALQKQKAEKRLKSAASTCHLMATIYFRQKDYYNARLFSKDAISLAQEAHSKEVLRDSYLLYSQILQAGNDYEMALTWYQLHLAIRDSILNSERARLQELARQQIAYEKRDQELKLKLVDEERKDLAIRQQQLENEKLRQELLLLKSEEEINDYIRRQEEMEKQRQIQGVQLEKQELLSLNREQQIAMLQVLDSVQKAELRTRRIENQRDQQRIDLLEKDQQLKAQELQRIEENRRWMRWVGLLFFIIFLLIVMGLLHTRRVNRQLSRQKAEIQYKNQALEQKNQEVSSQAQSLRRANKEIQHKNLQLEQKNSEITAQHNALEASYTKLEKTLKKLKTAQSQLVEAEKMASLGQLTAGIAHEINNPINFVSANVNPLRRDLEEIKQLLARFMDAARANGNMAESMARATKFAEEIDLDFVLMEVNSLLNGIEEGALRTREIVKGLRNFSRLDENSYKLANINEGLTSTLTLLRPKIRDRIKIEKDLATLPAIDCLPGRINQVFMNILNNAIQAIKGQGQIFIKTEMVGEQVHVRIRDTGKGMTEQVRTRIFEPFFTTKDVGEGTGLGLSISYGIIEQHNGKIEVKSQPGQGTEFIITLPLKQSPASHANGVSNV